MSRALILFVLVFVAVVWAGDSPAAIDSNERGITLLQEGHAQDAVVAFEEALSEQPDSGVLKRNLAAGLAALAEDSRRDRGVVEAIRLLDRAVQLHPGRLRYRVLLGRVRFESNEDQLRDAAREDFEFVLERDPDHLDALVNLGQIAYMERRLEAAVRHWQHALRLRPQDRDVEARLEKALRELQVERSFEELLDPHFQVRYPPQIPLRRAQELLALCQEARGELSTLYQSYPPRIVVTLYTPAQFRTATRMHGWVAGLSDGTIRLTVRPSTPLSSLKATIYHELTHHIVRGLAPRAPVWLHEGLAQIEEKKSVEAAEGRLARAGPVEPAILSAEVLRQADARKVSLFYDVALSFTRYLGHSRRGALQDLLRELGKGVPEGEAMRTTFGATRAELFDRWRERIRTR